MTSDEQEFGSIRYVYRPILLIRLRSGRIAVADGLTRELRGIYEHDDVRLQQHLTDAMSKREERRPETAPKALDLSEITL